VDFNISVYGEIPLGDGWRLLITSTTISTWFAMVVLISLAVVVRIKVKNFTPVPVTRFQKVIEALVELFENFGKGTLSEKYHFTDLGSWFFGMFALIWTMNLSGLLGFRPATADVMTTAAFGISTFIILHYTWIKVRAPKGYIKDFMQPNPLFFPINLISEIALPVALSFRLFGNVLGGVIILGMVYGMFPVFMRLGIPAALHVYFDLFSGSLQAFIFTILSMTFIRSKLPD